MASPGSWLRCYSEWQEGASGAPGDIHDLLDAEAEWGQRLP
jgi:hypothetical protein